MSESKQNLELLQNTLKQLEIILKDLGVNITDNPQLLTEVNNIVNSTEKLVVELQKKEDEDFLEKREDEDFFTAKKESELITENPPKITPKKGKVSGFLIGGIVTLVIIIAVGFYYFILPEMEVKIAQETPKIEQPIEETEIPSGIPPELTTPEVPQKVETITPELDLTPEQGLIAAIKNQIAAIKNRYVEGLVIAIEPNFSASRLTVKVSNNWDELEQSNQVSIADDIFKEAQKLDFKKLQITNIQGEVVARSPVVGNNMIILNN
jgi:hypothetical protein